MQPTEEFVSWFDDKSGKKWALFKEINKLTGMTRWWAWPHKSAGIKGEGKATVRTHTEEDLHLRPMVFLYDITIEPEDRGVGTLILQAVIQDCKQRGHIGIEGNLSEADRGHFGKLAYWYPKNGFRIEFYNEEERERRRTEWLGRVWINFGSIDAL